MEKHIILEKANLYDISNGVGTPDGFAYQSEKGYWVNEISGEALVKCKGPNVPTSKKFDMETGEDHKGE